MCWLWKWKCRNGLHRQWFFYYLWNSMTYQTVTYHFYIYMLKSGLIKILMMMGSATCQLLKLANGNAHLSNDLYHIYWWSVLHNALFRHLKNDGVFSKEAWCVLWLDGVDTVIFEDGFIAYVYRSGASQVQYLGRSSFKWVMQTWLTEVLKRGNKQIRKQCAFTLSNLFVG